MTLTDADVARAAGWKEEPYNSNVKGWRTPEERFQLWVPAFTTSLDAITRQIEAEGLGWEAGRGGAAGAWAHIQKTFSRESAEAPTAVLALCRAYVAYKEGTK